MVKYFIVSERKRPSTPLTRAVGALYEELEKLDRQVQPEMKVLKLSVLEGELYEPVVSIVDADENCAMEAREEPGQTIIADMRGLIERAKESFRQKERQRALQSA